MIDFEILQGDSLRVLRSLPASSIDVGLCSPPYWGQRYYGELGADQLGIEPNHADYIDKLADRFSEGTQADRHSLGGHWRHAERRKEWRDRMIKLIEEEKRKNPHNTALGEEKDKQEREKWK